MKLTPQERTAEKLKDRRDYRTALIERRNNIDVKISRVEDEIKTLRSAALFPGAEGVPIYMQDRRRPPVEMT